MTTGYMDTGYVGNMDGGGGGGGGVRGECSGGSKGGWEGGQKMQGGCRNFQKWEWKKRHAIEKLHTHLHFSESHI